MGRNSAELDLQPRGVEGPSSVHKGAALSIYQVIFLLGTIEEEPCSCETPE